MPDHIHIMIGLRPQQAPFLPSFKTLSHKAANGLKQTK